MASTEIQIVNISNLEKIQRFLNDAAYKEVLENSENFNTRLCIERRLRMPFLDPQTGVAQNHCALFMKQKQRMPGFRDGQIYTYPSSRWRKQKRQYLLHHHNYRAFSFRENQDVPGRAEERKPLNDSVIPPIDNSAITAAAADTDSKDSHSHRADEKEWFYDEIELNHVEDFPEDPESDLDYDETYTGRKRKKKNTVSKKSNQSFESTPVKRGRGRGRRKGDSESRRSKIAQSSTQNSNSSPPTVTEEPQLPAVLPPEQQKLPSSEECDVERRKIKQKVERAKAPPSPYCDFCLGDTRENKKTLLPEELVSCSDCGRSGHPSCLQFTPNMIISVKRYRWQCIECKYCSICGTSDNDDQLLFCDDCDRGYHMYCLSPPLTDPPEGSWSCKLCLDEFHSGKKMTTRLLPQFSAGAVNRLRPNSFSGELLRQKTGEAANPASVSTRR